MKNLLACFIFLGYQFHLLAQCQPDKLPPVITPKANVQVNLDGLNCSASVQASDLLQSVSDNCSSSSQVDLRLRRAGTDAGYPSMMSQSSLTFSTADLSKPVVVEIWAKDAAENATFAYAGISVNNPSGCVFHLLPDTLRARLENGDGIEDIQWLVYGIAPPPPGSFIQNHDALYLSESMFSGQYADNVYTIKPVKNDNPLNGVTTYDIVLIMKHLFGQEPFNSPYKLISADADRNGQITMNDLVELRQLILGITIVLQHNSSWRFIPDDYVFSPGNPMSVNLPTSVQFNRNRQTPLPDFIPVKIGDVNNSAVTNSLIQADDRTPVTLRVQDARVEGGTTISVPVLLNDIPGLTGLQMALGFNPDVLAFNSIQPGDLPGFSTDNYFQPEPGQLTVSWIAPDLEPVSSEKPLFYLEFNVLKPALLSEILALHQRLGAEVYDADQHIGSVNLEFLPAATPEQTRIYPPTPNPVVSDITFRVDMASAGNISIELAAVDGRVFYVRSQPYEAGSASVTVPASVLTNASGVLLYTIQAGDTRTQGRVVLR